MLHGNGAMIADLEISAIINRAAKRYRVIAFDRPGFGHGIVRLTEAGSEGR